MIRSGHPCRHIKTISYTGLAFRGLGARREFCPPDKILDPPPPTGLHGL